MIQRTAARNDVAQNVAERIASAIKPWRIVLFGSRARGDSRDHSDYDFYIEIDAADDDRLHDVHGRILALCRGTLGDLDFKVCRRGDLERRRDDPGTIEWDVAREGIVLYADAAATTRIEPASDRVREQSPESLESLREWLEAGEADLRARADLQASGNQHTRLICWLSQQTCEKHMKALLVSRNLNPVRTHDLTLVLLALRAAGLPLAGLDADCALLTKFAVAPRYPGEPKLSDEDARLASEAADRVVTAVRALFPPSLR